VWDLEKTHSIVVFVEVWDLDKVDVSDVVDAPVYKCPVDSMVCANDRQLVFVKTSSKGLRYVDSFGIDIWNASSGKSIPFLPFGRYGKLLQMEVSQHLLYYCIRLVTCDM